MASLNECVFRNDLIELRMDLARGADANERNGEGRTPLIHATIDNRLEIAKLLLDSGAEPNAMDEAGNTALHYAAQEHHPEMAALLIGHRARVDAEDGHGNTPLWRAVYNSRGRGELIAVLLKAGADKNHRNKHGKTPTDLAKTIANYNIAHLLE